MPSHAFSRPAEQGCRLGRLGAAPVPIAPGFGAIGGRLLHFPEIRALTGYFSRKVRPNLPRQPIKSTEDVCEISVTNEPDDARRCEISVTKVRDIGHKSASYRSHDISRNALRRNDIRGLRKRH